MAFIGPYQVYTIDGAATVARVADLNQLATTVNNAAATAENNAVATAKTYADGQVATDRGRLTAIETKNTAQDGRLDLVETKNTAQDADITTARTNAVADAKVYTDAQDAAYRVEDRALWRAEDDGHEAAARTYTDTRETAVRASFTISHIALDTDGTPYFSPGSMTVKVLQDTDGTPYYQAA